MDVTCAAGRLEGGAIISPEVADKGGWIDNCESVSSEGPRSGHTIPNHDSPSSGEPTDRALSPAAFSGLDGVAAALLGLVESILRPEAAGQ
ncbi:MULTISPECIES: hypothetical protein [unclassified Streptomyces]|uniref:hypothetical protein n=1 Tax=unclassified Streptomyces TaxID=2593676 RepID=UPI001BE9B061|nr:MULTISPECIES: hypothetical protein [unclassified Streptomyces]MBT2403192.1 hypothetical protein [Streptomyces sp. ISL-21]MBT2459230.1 hypothetical protein [Streptomyces sp. ISL-86]MBT2610131.1 hypothetical protein [Streptomyces sp. ISL-87]